MNKVVCQFSILLFVLLTLLSCSSRESESTAEGSVEVNYVAEIADSVMVQRLSMVEIEAVNSQTNELLLHDMQTNEMLVVDNRGNTLSIFNPFIESPSYMGRSSFGWSFFGKDSLAAFGFSYFYLFSKEGNKLKRLAYPNELGGGILMDFFPKRLTYYKSGTREEVIALMPGGRGISPRSQKYYDSLNLVFALDFSNESTRPVFERPAESIYRTIGKYIDHGFPSMDHLNDGKFALIYRSDDHVYIYDAPSNELINTILIPEAYRPAFKAVDFGSKKSPDITRAVGYIFGLGDQFAVMVNGLVPESELENIKGIQRWWESPEMKQLEEKYGGTSLLLFDQERFLGEVSWNIEMSDYRFLGDANGYIWLKRTYEDERDYQTFLKIKIVPETD